LHKKDSVIELVINTIAKPMQIGFYENGTLQELREYEGLTSDILLPTLQEIVKHHKIEKIIYTNGPGSHMATKIAFVLLKTLEIIQEIPIYAISAFELNGNKPIKALGKLYFIKEKENIITKRFENELISSFFMPKELSNLSISKDIEPAYNISAV